MFKGLTNWIHKHKSHPHTEEHIVGLVNIHVRVTRVMCSMIFFFPSSKNDIKIVLLPKLPEENVEVVKVVWQIAIKGCAA